MPLQIDISKFIKQYLHPDTLTQFNIQWFEALLYPLRGLLIRFYQKRKKDLYDLGHNGQTCYLRGMLNDEFDPDQRRIEVYNAESYEHIYFYPEDDDKNVHFETVLFPPESWIGADSVSFYVEVPLALNLSADRETQMHALLKKYKLLSKTYSIIYN